MILNVSEEQKKIIESQGYMVVEFKLWCRKLGKMILEYAEQLEHAYREKDKYPFVRSLGRAYEANVSRKVIYHRCRDRC